MLKHGSPKKMGKVTIKDPELGTIILEEMKNFSSEDSNGTMYESSDISQEKIYKAMQAIHDFGYSIISIGVGKTRFHLRIICGI